MKSNSLINGFSTNPVPEERDGFKFRSGNLALDFIATLTSRLKPTPKELLISPADLARWLVVAGLSTTFPKVTETDLQDARDLREALYRLAYSCINKEAFGSADRTLINRWAAQPSLVPQLEKQGLIWTGSNVKALLAAIARAGAELFGGPLASRIHKCSREGCSILFVDTSRSGRRRWCSMAFCGNKTKVNAYRQRNRNG